jgi:hypothetical protein
MEREPVWFYKLSSKKNMSISQRLRFLFSFPFFWCTTKKERCERCHETIRPYENSRKSGCNPEELHTTCACFIGDYFATDALQTKLWRETAEKQMERFIENYCCIRSAAITILPTSALEDINENMNKPCDCQNNMYACNKLCCNSSASCVKMLLQLCDNYRLQNISLSDEQYNALNAIVNAKN